jgi:RNA polymerase sigma-70 factor (ECF subfamily)
MVMVTAVETNIQSRAGSFGHVDSRALHAPVHQLDQNASDAILIEAIAEGDRRAMALLYRRHSVRLYRFILRMSGDAALTEDLVSEVFLEAWRHADGFQAKSQVSTWLLAIARNKVLSARRRRWEQQLDDQEAASIEDTADDPQNSIEKKDRGALILSCLAQLSATQREVVDLIYYHEKSVEEVARIVGVPANTVKTRMFYARQRMGRLLEAAGFEH